MGFRKTITAMTIHDEKENPIYGETVTKVELADEAGGLFLLISQPSNDTRVLRFEIEELEIVLTAARALMKAEKGKP